MLCQVCGASNGDDDEYCQRCNQKLLVVSGPLAVDPAAVEEDDEEGFSLDEHLLERISVLEEAVRRTTDTVRGLLAAVRKQEHSILLHQTGFAALRELLEAKGLLGGDEWVELWESKMGFQLQALERRDRFVAAKERIAGLYRGGGGAGGERQRAFVALLEEGDRGFADFDVDRAMAALLDAFSLDRDNYELAAFLGETSFNDGDGERALHYYQRVLEAQPDHFDALVYGGVLTHERGADESDGRRRAVALLERAVGLYPDHFLPAFSLGAVYASGGELRSAVQMLMRAVDLEPLPQALYMLGNCLYEMGQPGAAIRDLQRAVEADPGFEEAWYLLGLAYLDRGWNRKALDAFRRAQRLNPRKLRYDDLVRHLSSGDAPPLPAVEGEAGEWYERGEQHRRGEAPKRAADCYRRALLLDPDNPTLLLSTALVSLQLGRVQEIEPLARRVLDLAPGERLRATAYAALAEALRSQGRFQEGNRLGRRLLAEGESPFTRTIAYYEMACNLAEMESGADAGSDLDTALDYARRSVELAPDELKAFPLAALGWVHYKRREYDRAVDFLSRASEHGTSATTLTQLGMALLAAGDEERAKTALAEARALESRAGGLEERMLQYMKDSAHVLERARRKL